MFNLQAIKNFLSAEIKEVSTEELQQPLLISGTSSGSNTASKSFVSQTTQTLKANYVSTQAHDVGFKIHCELLALLEIRKEQIEKLSTQLESRTVENQELKIQLVQAHTSNKNKLGNFNM